MTKREHSQAARVDDRTGGAGMSLLLRRASWIRIGGVLVLAALGVAATLEAQFRRNITSTDIARPDDFDGRFHFCRLVYTGGTGGRGGSWATDYPRADINMSIRLAELTRTNVSVTRGAPNHLLVRPTDDVLFQCPFLIMAAPGSAFLDEEEAARLREYLLKGGFLWVDDFWGSYQWEQWVSQFQKILPAAEYAIVDLPLDHALLRVHYEVTEIPQIPNIGYYIRSGGDTSEQGFDSETPHARIVSDDRGRIMVLMTHNTDISDSWEREGDDPSYFYAFSPRGYAFGINAVLYSLIY